MKDRYRHRRVASYRANRSRWANLVYSDGTVAGRVFGIVGGQISYKEWQLWLASEEGQRSSARGEARTAPYLLSVTRLEFDHSKLR